MPDREFEGVSVFRRDVELGDHLLGIERNKPSTSKTSLNVFRRYSGLESRVERRKKVLFSDIGYACSHYPLDLLTICCLKRAKTSNIKWLEDIRRVRRHIERNNVILFVVELEVSRVVAVVAIEDKEAINPSYLSFSILIEVLNLF